MPGNVPYYVKNLKPAIHHTGEGYRRICKACTKKYKEVK